MIEKKVINVTRHIYEEQMKYPHATGDLSGLLADLTLACKIIHREVNKAGLVELLGLTGEINVQGEAVKKLDDYAQQTLYRALDHGGHLCAMASEEVADIIPIPKQFRKGKYVILFDPLDGSSNIEANASIGTIFSIYRKVSKDGPDGTIEDFLQAGTEQVCAGYVIYGSSTVLVYSTGVGVHGFTLDPSVGEFLLSHPNIKIPESGYIYSVNEGNDLGWDDGTKRFIQQLKDPSAGPGRPYSARYIGSLVSDFHRTLLYGGIFLYPADKKNRRGKLRLNYEAKPVAFLAERAGGMATDGKQRILDIAGEDLHERVPLIVGSKDNVEEYLDFVQGRR